MSIRDQWQEHKNRARDRLVLLAVLRRRGPTAPEAYPRLWAIAVGAHVCIRDAEREALEQWEDALAQCPSDIE